MPHKLESESFRSPFHTEKRVPVIHKARITDVDLASHTVSVATEFTAQPMTGISFSVPYHHHYNGEGILFMPEVGSLCWLCEPSDNSRAFVMAWSPAEIEGDFRSNRPELNPGDIYLGTRDENFLVLRRGGVVQIGGGPLSQRMYIPVNNVIRDLCENYHLNSIAGDLEWTVGREEETTDGNRPTKLTIKAKEKASDKNPIAILQMGSHGEGSTTTLSLTVKASGSEGAATQILLTIGKDGKIALEAKSDIEWKLDGSLTLEAVEDIQVTSVTGAVKIDGLTEFSAKSLNSKVESNGTTTIQGGVSVSIDSLIIKLGGDGATSFAIKGTDLIAWLASHTHSVPALGSTLIPSQAATLGSLLSKTVMLK